MEKILGKNKLWSLAFLLSLVIELQLLLSSYREFGGVFVSPILTLLNNFLLVYSAYRVKRYNFRSTSTKSKYYQYLYYLVFAGLVYWVGIELSHIIEIYPLDSKVSDIIPSLQKYNTRLLAGEFPYKLMPYDGYAVVPNYLPMMWLPFSIAEVLHFDYRLLAYLAFVLMIFVYWRQVIPQTSVLEAILKVVVPFWFLYELMKDNTAMFGTNTELLVVAFYLFLAYTMKKRSFIWVGLGVAMCLLSRFSLLFWLPLYAYLVYKRENLAFLVKAMGVVVMSVLLIYVLPFMTTDPYIFFKGMKYYGSVAVGEWTVKPWQKEGEYPYHLGKGIGFAVYFYEYGKSTLEGNIRLSKTSHILLSLGIVLVSYLVYQFKRPKISISLFALLSFKIYLAIFYGFMFVPFMYLYLLPLMVSVAILMELNLFGRKPLS